MAPNPVLGAKFTHLTIRDHDRLAAGQARLARRGAAALQAVSVRRATIASRCYSGRMRTTVTFDDDVAAEIARLRRERHIGVSAAINELARRGMARGTCSSPFVQRTSSGHARLDITNVAEVLDLLDGSTSR
ncbi:MAG: hypothetical protein M3308_04785 [Actinomycetota bacterium]|nr:hypothetical protein [Actinomycetota bacterium]